MLFKSEKFKQSHSLHIFKVIKSPNLVLEPIRIWKKIKFSHSIFDINHLTQQSHWKPLENK